MNWTNKPAVHIEAHVLKSYYPLSAPEPPVHLLMRLWNIFHRGSFWLEESTSCLLVTSDGSPPPPNSVFWSIPASPTEAGPRALICMTVCDTGGYVDYSHWPATVTLLSSCVKLDGTIVATVLTVTIKVPWVILRKEIKKSDNISGEEFCKVCILYFLIHRRLLLTDSICQSPLRKTGLHTYCW